MECISPNLWIARDTCNVYAVRSCAEICNGEALLVDFGDGAILDELPALGIRRVTDILITHHHRDQAQGLARALAERSHLLASAPDVLAGAPDLLAGVRVWAPETEQELFHSVELHWQSRPLLNNYDVRQDRFSLLDSIPLAGTLKDYAITRMGGRDWTVLPTPGHTPGSLTLLAEIDGRKVAFTGDLIAGAGKVWSMAALQWSYQNMEGAAASVPSLVDLKERGPERLLPSHGEAMDDPAAAIDLLVKRLLRLLEARQENLRLTDWLRQPYERITPHLLRNRTSVANSYVLLSESGKALLIDYGYDFLTGILSGAERAIHRPWLYTLAALKRDFGVTRIDVVVATHYHDDHVAGFNLLRAVEGTQVWAGENFAPILEHPQDYDLPCLWYDPIPVDRVLAPGQRADWEEYTLTVFPLPGHTRYATAVAFMVDGKRVLATGDQYKGNAGLAWNYVYQNRFEIEDYRTSAALYAGFAPDLILPGHWDPLWVSADYLDCLLERGELLASLHRDLLPLETVDLGGEGFAVRIQPYTWQGKCGSPVEYRVEVRNPLPQAAEVQARMVLPEGWQTPQPVRTIDLDGGAVGYVTFVVVPPAGVTGRRFRLAVDLTASGMRFGQQAEALVDLIQ